MLSSLPLKFSSPWWQEGERLWFLFLIHRQIIVQITVLLQEHLYLLFFMESRLKNEYCFKISWAKLLSKEEKLMCDSCNEENSRKLTVTRMCASCIQSSGPWTEERMSVNSVSHSALISDPQRMKAHTCAEAFPDVAHAHKLFRNVWADRCNTASWVCTKGGDEVRAKQIERSDV